MKKLIILLLVISFTALEAQDYQYFTAKQGIPKAMEIAKQYFKSDSVELYEIRCIRTGEDSLGNQISLESINPYNDTNGTSIFWYYKFCNEMDSCFYIRVRIKNDFYIVDTIFYNYQKYWFYTSINSNDIIIDSDSLNDIIDHCYHNKIIENSKKRLRFFFLFFSKANHFEEPVWFDNSIGYFIEINAKTGDCWDVLTPVIENKNNDYIIHNTSELITENIIIELNSDMFQEAGLRLYDQLGVLHFTDIIREKKYNLNTYKVPSGMYVLQIKYGGNVFAKTVLVVH